MSLEKRAHGFSCPRCGQVYTSKMKLAHHLAADHSPKTLKDIHTMKDIPHSAGSR